MEELVSYEIAVQAKIDGFDLPCNHIFQLWSRGKENESITSRECRGREHGGYYNGKPLWGSFSNYLEDPGHPAIARPTIKQLEEWYSNSN